MSVFKTNFIIIICNGTIFNLPLVYLCTRRCSHKHAQRQDGEVFEAVGQLAVAVVVDKGHGVVTLTSCRSSCASGAALCFVVRCHRMKLRERGFGVHDGGVEVVVAVDALFYLRRNVPQFVGGGKQVNNGKGAADLFGRRTATPS